MWETIGLCAASVFFIVAPLILGVSLMEKRKSNKKIEFFLGPYDTAIGENFVGPAFVELLLLCVASVALVRVYPVNTFMHDLKLLTLLAILFTVALIDGKTHTIPNASIVTALLIRLIYYVLELFLYGKEFFSMLKGDLLACLIPLAFLILGVFIIRNGMGMGDIKLMLVISLFQGLSGAVSSIFCSLIVVFLISAVFLIMRKKKRKDVVPFGPSVFIGTYLSIVLTGM